MREHLFEDSTDMPNVHESISLGSLVDAQQTRESLEGKHVCPYCGAVNESPVGPCPNCSLENTPAGRKATKSRIGPWYVLQRRNPAAPGMKYDMLLNFVRKGRVKPRTVVRGPTTHQLWRFAAHVKGLSREFGLCYSCGGKIDAISTVCPQCNRLQLPPLNPDALLETGDAESPPGAVAMTGSAAGGGGVSAVPAANGVGYGESAQAPAAAAQEEANHDIVVPALTDAPAEPVATAIAPGASASPASGSPASAEPVAQPAASASAEVAGISNSALQSMSVLAAPAAPEAPVGARARSAALKASGGLGGMAGPRIVPLAAAGNSPAPLLTADAPPVSFRAPRGRWRGAAEIVLFLLVLVGALGGGVLLVDPALREWVQATCDRMLKGMHLKTDEQPMPSLDADQSGVPSITGGSAADHLPPSPPAGVPQITPAPAVVPAPAPTSPPPPASPPVVAHSDQPPATGDHPAAPAPSDTDPPDDTTVASDQAKAKALYFAAVDAETRDDWATAVSDYRKILALPKSVQYTDVETRLRNDEGLLAQAQAGGK